MGYPLAIESPCSIAIQIIIEEKKMLLVFGILPSPLATVNLMALLLACAKLLALVVLKLTTPSMLQLLHD